MTLEPPIRGSSTYLVQQRTHCVMDSYLGITGPQPHICAVHRAIMTSALARAGGAHRDTRTEYEWLLNLGSTSQDTRVVLRSHHLLQCLYGRQLNPYKLTEQLVYTMRTVGAQRLSLSPVKALFAGNCAFSLSGAFLRSRSPPKFVCRLAE